MSTFIILSICRFRVVLWSGDLFLSVNGVSHKHINSCQNNLELNISQFAAPTATHLQAPSRKKRPLLQAVNAIYQIKVSICRQREEVWGKAPASQNSLEFKTELKEVKGGVSDQPTRRCHL